MIPLIKHYFLAFFLDENAARRFLAGLGGLIGMALGTVLAFGVPVVLAWTPREIVQHGLVAVVGAIAAMLPGPALRKPEAAPEVQP